MKFYSEKLEEPVLTFGRGTIDPYPIRGLRTGGPYDVSFVSTTTFDALLLCPQLEEKLAKEFVSKLQSGDYPFEGFPSLFKKSMHIDSKFITYTKNNFENQVQDIIKTILDKKDIVFILLPEGVDESFYFQGKLLFCSQGIPSQFFSGAKVKENIERGSLGYYLQNFSLAVYAKLGRRPWVLHRSESMGSDIILGVGGTRFNGRNYFAFTTLFERDGAFDWWSADIPKDPTDEGEYVNLLKEQITKAVNEYKKQNPDFSIERISFHISGKRPGKLEVQAIGEAMKESEEEFKYAIFHINTTSPFWVIDGGNTNRFFHPPKGLKIRLSSKDSLIITDEPGKSPRAPIHPTRVTLIGHNFKEDEFRNVYIMVKEIYQLTRMNWKGFRAKNVPVSVYYPQLIARFLEKFGTYGKQEHIISMRSHVSLKRKAWFL